MQDRLYQNYVEHDANSKTNSESLTFGIVIFNNLVEKHLLLKQH